MDYLTRISYNSSNWNKPTAEAREYEQTGSYNQQFGFGHEDWLFRTEWQIDGWRYAFLQGVNKSLQRLQRENRLFGVRLFCVQPDKRRRYVAEIRELECLDEKQARRALHDFEQRGWLARMRQEIVDVGGDPAALGNAQYATHILNIRYRESALHWLAPDQYARSGDPILYFNRYSLIALENIREKYAKGNNRRAGTESFPSLQPITRTVVARSVEISPTHFLMQAKLMEQLAREFPGAQVLREEDGIDVIVRTAAVRVPFEIKSMLSAPLVIRESLGQLLEYLYRAGPDPSRATSLVIVGRCRLDACDQAYLDWLRSQLAIPLSYRLVEI